jgi:hypothetical protein
MFVRLVLGECCSFTLLYVSALHLPIRILKLRGQSRSEREGVGRGIMRGIPLAPTRRRDFLVSFLQTELGVFMYIIKFELYWHWGQ